MIRFLALTLVLALSAQAQQSSTACEAAYKALLADSLVAESGIPVTDCNLLLVVVNDALANQATTRATDVRIAAATRSGAALISPRDIQPLRGASGGGAGSAGQAEAVTALAPEPFAGGSLSAVGTEDGAGLLASISLNPLVLTGDLDDPNALARQTRLFDLSLIVPVDQADRDGDGRIDYVGFRGRVNVAGARAGDAAYDSLLARYRDALTDVLLDAGRLADETEALLDAAPDVEACARTLVTGEGNGCDGALAAPAATLYETLDQAAADVRHAADAIAFGLDLRLDVGDPTLGAEPGADGIALAALLAGEREISGIGLDTAVRGYLGVAYADRDSMETARFALDGALGVAFSRPFGLQQITIQAGLLASIGLSDAATSTALDRDHVMFSASANVPITSTQSAALRLAVPLVGETTGPVLSVTGSWHLPLPGRD